MTPEEVQGRLVDRLGPYGAGLVVRKAVQQTVARGASYLAIPEPLYALLGLVDDIDDPLIVTDTPTCGEDAPGFDVVNGAVMVCLLPERHWMFDAPADELFEVDQFCGYSDDEQQLALMIEHGIDAERLRSRSVVWADGHTVDTARALTTEPIPYEEMVL